MTSFTLKIIALITMFIDHSGYVFAGNFSFCNFIGRIAFPIFAFQISEGYKHTKNLKKYFLRLGIFALISQIPFSLFTFKYHGGNILNLNGVGNPMTVSPEIKEGRVFVPVEDLAYLLGIHESKIQWNPDTNTLTLR